MGNYRPLLYTLAFILSVGTILSVMMSPFVDVNTYEPEGILTGLIDFVEDGFIIEIPFFLGLFGTSVNIDIVGWFLLGSATAKEYLVNALISLSLIPDIILTPIVIIMTIALIWSFIILIKDMIPFT